MNTTKLEPRVRPDVAQSGLESGPVLPAPAAGECHLWTTRVDDDEDRWRELLDPSELAAATRSRVDTVRRTFVTSRGLQRLVGAHYLSTPPHSVRIERRCDVCGDIQHGRPRWVDARGIDYSTSHSGGRVVLAVVRSGRVGLDLQLQPDIGSAGGLDDLAATVLTAAEMACYRGLPGSLRADYVCRMWVRKEAALKLDGHGLGIEPDTVDVRGVWTVIPPRLDPAWSFGTGTAKAPMEGFAAPIHLSDVLAERGYRAALASTSVINRVKIYPVHHHAGAG